MIINDVERLTDAGIMSYLIQTYKKLNTLHFQTESEPTILSIDDLAFGFNIWLRFCGSSLVAFLVEMLLNTKFCRKLTISLKCSKFKKIKFAKVHQRLENKCQKSNKNQKPSQELVKKFKVKRNKTENEVEIDNSLRYLKSVDSTIAEEELEPFGEMLTDKHKPINFINL